LEKGNPFSNIQKPLKRAFLRVFDLKKGLFEVKKGNLRVFSPKRLKNP